MKSTIATLAAALVPAIAIAQQPYPRDTARPGRDTTRAEAQRNQQREQPQVRAEARGAVDAPRRRGRVTWGLSTTQIRELQQALQNINCYDAAIDGIIGPITRRGIGCAMRHHNVTGSDPNALTQALGLNFQIDANAGLGAVMRAGAQQDQRGMRGEQRPTDPTQRTGRDPQQQRDTVQARDTIPQRDTLQGQRPTTTPTPHNVPPR
jgi:hypothetical protein